MKFNCLTSLVIVALAPIPAWAQAAPAAERDIAFADTISETSITVVASGSNEPLADTGQTVSVIAADEITGVQGADIVRVLERVPGITASRNGGLGGFTGVRVRGAEAEQLLVLVDGVRLADPGSPGAGFDFATLLPYGISKIELLRGSNSTIWGSQAIGGVLAVSTASAEGVEGSLEYGAHDSLSGQVSAGTGWAGGTAALNAAMVDSHGFSSSAAGIEPDGLRQWQLSGRASQAAADWLTLDIAGRAARARVELDGFPPHAFTLADTAEYQRTRQASGRLGAKAYWQNLILDGGYSLTETEREQFDPAFGAEPGYATRGRSQRAELRGIWELSRPIALRFGAEREWTRFDSTVDTRQRAATTGAYAQLGYVSDGIAINAGVRRDNHSDFGGEWSSGADARVPVFGGWSLHASYGEGFKAPSLFQLFSDFGNARLAPERSRGFDLGLGIANRNDAPYFDVTVFRRDVRSLIGFVSCSGETDGICTDRPFGTYDNTGRARAQGIEAEGGVRPLPEIGLSAAYAYIAAEDRTAGSATFGNDLPRRPRHALTVTGEWLPVGPLTLAADLRVVSESFDDAANLVRMHGYQVLTLRMNWDLNDRLALFGRVENAWNEHYQTAAGYATAGRGAYFGVRSRL